MLKIYSIKKHEELEKLLCHQYSGSHYWMFWNVVDMYYTNMRMRMSRLDHGLLDWMWSTLMIGGCVVEHHQVIIIIINVFLIECCLGK